ncbi:MAG: hypothetical protein HUK40_06775 [Desulfobacter sp.]|nr:hypothetical protein [Desulfobacter sp.]
MPGAGASPRGAEKSIDSFGSRDLVNVLSTAIVLPGVVGMGFSWVMTQNRLSAEQVATWMEALSRAHVFWYLAGIFAAALISTGLLAFLLRARMTKADPVTEVSELRENWQESVHPNEIFINLDNLVMANRRYKEVPNRVYKELDPQLNEQVEGKGDFRGEMIQEVQPRVMPMAWRPGFLRARLTSLLAGNLCHLASLALTILLAFALVRVYQHTGSQANAFGDVFSSRGEDLMTLGANAAHLFVIMVIFNGFANLLVNTAHLFYAEIQFESLLIYFKCEGTFTESKISTGTGIHDSTRSENTLIRSSITPWVIVSRIVSTTFAATGMRNLEHPRYILEMRKSDKDLRSIKEDMIDFLKDRESIASITSVRDLGNASQIYQLNQQTRPGGTPPKEIEKEAETAGYLRQEKDLTPQDSE